MENLKCYRCGSSDFDLSATYPPIFIRPKETTFLFLKRGAQAAAKVCKSCGAVMLTVNKNEIKKLQKKTKGSKLIMTIFSIAMITLLALMQYHLNALEKGAVEKHKQLEIKENEVRLLNRNIKRPSTNQDSLLDYIIAAAEEKKDNALDWKSIKADVMKQPAEERRHFILKSIEKTQGLKS
jgi:hypothetical protein